MRSLVAVSWPQIQSFNRANTLIIMPIASIEQHGRHLPVGTDYLLLQSIVEALSDFQVEGYEGVILPVLPFGLNTEHSAFAGTISLPEQCIADILRQQTAAFINAGFQNFVLLNSHGGNSGLIDSFIRTCRRETGCRMTTIDYYRGKPFAGHEDMFDNPVGLDVHAGEFETSLMLHLYPDMVDMHVGKEHLCECNVPARQLPFGWLTHEVSKSGVIGDATLANAQKGKAYFEVIMRYVTGALEECCLSLGKDKA